MSRSSTTKKTNTYGIISVALIAFLMLSAVPAATSDQARGEGGEGSSELDHDHFGDYPVLAAGEIFGEDPTISVISAGRYHSLALNIDGTVWALGYNGQGQLGDGTATSSSCPVQVVASSATGDYLTDIKAISAGSNHSLALNIDGTVWAWGYNYYGQLGDGTTTDSSCPVQVKASPAEGDYLTDVKSISAGDSHSFALKNDGTVWAWGYNGIGQLGDGTVTSSSCPVQVMASSATGDYLTDVKAISAGGNHSLALKNDGTVWAWGYNYYGQLGNGATSNRSYPVQARASSATGDYLTDVKAISAGLDHSFALKNDGTVWAWGYNYYGQLGDGTATSRSYPVQVRASSATGDYLTDVKAISAGGNHSLVLKNDGTVWAWGDNGNGRLGDGTATSRSYPVKVKASSATGDYLTDVKAISAGRYNSLALKSDGTVWAWGDNFYGQLGDGTTTDSSYPVQTSGLNLHTAATIDPPSMVFIDAMFGYGTQTAQIFTLTNTGIGTLSNMSASLAAGTAFEISTSLSGTSVVPGNTLTVSVRPITGLAINTYADTLTVSGDSGISISVPLSFTVTLASLTGTATISNTSPRIGDTLNGSLSGGNNSGTLSYQWKADGTDVGTGSSYIVTVADLGKVITLEITSSVETGALTSAATYAVVKKAVPAAPAAPSVDSKTHNSVTLTSNPSNEFSTDGSTWQDSNVFTGLSANTPYTFYQRVKETPDTLASGVSPVRNETTNTAPVAPTITSVNNTTVVNGTGGTFSVTATGNPSAMTYSLSGQPAGVSINSSTGVMTIAGTVAANIYAFTVMASNGTSPSATQSFTLTVNAPQPVTFTLSYNSNGGSGTVAPQIVNSGASFTVKSSAGIAAPNGKQFKNWNTSPNGSGTSYAPGVPITASSDVTLYAVWEITPSTTGSGNGGNDTFDDSTILIIFAIVTIGIVGGAIFFIIRKH